MSGKIAPTLAALSRNNWWGLPGKEYGSEGAEAWERAIVELRALLAVARAAERVKGLLRLSAPEAEQAEAALWRALSRLRRVSRLPEKGGRR